jgi:uncharacterized membrane protein YeiH
MNETRAEESSNTRIRPPLFAIIAGVIAGAGGGVGDDFSSRIQALATKEFLSGITVLGAAFGGIAIAVLALVAVWFDTAYGTILRNAGGWEAAMRPFRIVATVSVLSCLTAITGLFFYPLSPLWLQAVFLGVASGLMVWSIVGTLRIIDLLYKHGKAQARIDR